MLEIIKYSILTNFLILLNCRKLNKNIFIIFFQMKPIVRSKIKRSSESSASKSRNGSSGGKSWLRIILEFIFFLGWMICTGIAGYFLGHIPSDTLCPPSPIVSKVPDPVPSISVSASVPDCPQSSISAYDNIVQQWSCSKPITVPSEINKKLLPKENNYDKTKWKSIITVDPKAFFEKYLSQYPGDVQAVQPVVVFSHKPVESFDEVPDVCKVMDVAVVPDSPGVCVAVTETYHDVASYHLLHADRQPDGSFALSSNSLEGRTLPEEPQYAIARALLLEYFGRVEYVAQAVRIAPRFGQNRASVGCVVETVEEATLFHNSLTSATQIGISASKFCLFTTSSEVHSMAKAWNIKIAYLPELANLGSQVFGSDDPKEQELNAIHRKNFLRAWLAFAVAQSGNKMMWQSPGTIWKERPDNLIQSIPIVEIAFSFQGRQDSRASPFFASFDFFVAAATDRPVHLLHEILVHYDLVLTWNSLNALAAYRLAENNSRLV